MGSGAEFAQNRSMGSVFEVLLEGMELLKLV
jgi:hypothetical protein